MASEASSIGYGPRSRWESLVFDGDERNYELWETKFLACLRLKKLKSVILRNVVTSPITAEEQDNDREKNETAYAELIQYLDDRSLSLVMRDGKDDGRKSLKILREHYIGSGKPRIIVLYTTLTTLQKDMKESIIDYVIRAETASNSLKEAGEVISDSLLISMVLKGLPTDYKSFVVLITQSDKVLTFQEFKRSLRNFEETFDEKHYDCNSKQNDDSILNIKSMSISKVICYKCKREGHKVHECRKVSSLNSSDNTPFRKL